jgi:hypothetical protein
MRRNRRHDEKNTKSHFHASLIQISPSWDLAAQSVLLWKKVDLTGGWANLDLKKFTGLCK